MCENRKRLLVKYENKILFQKIMNFLIDIIFSDPYTRVRKENDQLVF